MCVCNRHAICTHAKFLQLARDFFGQSFGFHRCYVRSDGLFTTRWKPRGRNDTNSIKIIECTMLNCAQWPNLFEKQKGAKGLV